MTSALIEVPARWVCLFCLVIALLIGVLTGGHPTSPNLLGLEVLLLILALFVFGSIRYRIDKNAITYGALPIIFVTFFPIWWPNASLRNDMAQRGLHALWDAVTQTLLSLHHLEKLIHADTMLFILGLTFFVSVISQSRLLEAVSIRLLAAFKGRVFLTVWVITGGVSLASGILDGVSMIGLLIRVLLIIFVMAKLPICETEFIVMASVVITTVCGMWLAYGEPPNLILKSNLGLSDRFFLTHAAPLAIVAFITVSFFIYRRTASLVIPLHELDLLERHIADIRFLQAKQKGEIKELEDLLEAFKENFGEKRALIQTPYHQGHHPICAMMMAQADPQTICAFIREYLNETFVEPVLYYYCHRGDPPEKENEAAVALTALFEAPRAEREATQWWGKLAFLPFIGLLIVHAQHPNLPLFVSSFVGWGVAFFGIIKHTKMSRLALTEAAHEYKEYIFLFPLFLMITALSAAGFFDPIKTALSEGAVRWGPGPLAVIQFLAAGALSALLDNNVVADFFSRAIMGLPDLFLFAAAQIAGYATGGSLTHIGSAQSVVAFSFMLRYINPHFTPFDWIRAMWRLVLALCVVLIVAICLMAA